MLYQLVSWAYNFFLLCIFVRVILSWVPDLPQPLYPIRRFAEGMTDWAIRPLQRVIPPVPLGGMYLDISFIVLLILLQLVRGLLMTLISFLL